MQEGYVFSIEEILRIGDVTLQVLEYFHSRKPAVFYGDLKPANIMMTDQKRLYLVDFGSAVFSYSVSYQETKGTRGYAAPEQLHGKISAASDFYALGKTMEVLCGKKKFRYFLKCPALGKFIFRCCRTEPEKRWQGTAEARNELCKIHPLNLQLKAVLFPLAVALVVFVAVLGSGLDREKLPELSQMLTPVTAQYFTMEYQTGSAIWKEKIHVHIEKELQNLQKVYQKTQDQIRILELLAWNGQLADKADHAEIYYRQLLTYEPEYSKGYLEYGLFLCRQGRYQESRAVYRQWKNRAEEKRMQIADAFAEEWQEWKKEAGIILGRTKQSFLESTF